jgi:multisubunit Na+/H+ antiporter MnhG subunit
MMDRFTASAVCLIVGLSLIVLGVADVAGSASVLVIAGAALVLAPLLASVTDRRRSRRPAC